MPTKLTGLRNLLITVAAVAVILFVAEGAARLAQREDDAGMTVEQDMDIVYFCYEKTPLEQHVLSAATCEELKRRGVDLRGIKGEGYPVVDLPTGAEYTDGTVNIAVFGDSFVWGHGATNRNSLFWRQLERRLRAEGYDCRVTAVALPGADAYEELSWLTETNLMKEISPDIVIFGYVFNDAMPDRPDENDMSSEKWEEGLPLLSPVKKVFPALYERLIDYTRGNTITNKKYGTPNGDLYFTPLVGESLEKYQTGFIDKLDAFSAENSLPCAVVTLPNTPSDDMLRNLFGPIEGLYKDTSVYCRDLYPAFNRWYSAHRDKANLYATPHNTHPGNAVHAFYADYLAGYLKKNFGDVLGKPSGENLNSRLVCVNEATPYDINLKTVSSGAEGTEFSFDYPDVGVPHKYLVIDIETYALTYPLGTDYVMISFENPVDIGSVSLAHPSADGDDGSFALYYTSVNEKKGYDDGVLHEMTLSNDGVWEGSAGLVTSLCIHAPGKGAVDVKVSGRVSG